MRVAIFNDTWRFHAGSQSVMATLNAMLGRIPGVEIVARYDYDYPWHDRPDIDLTDIDAVVCNGEGTMHHDADAALFWLKWLSRAHARGARTAVVNTVWDGMTAEAVSLLTSVDLVATRDPLSTLQLAYYGVQCHQFVDLSLLPSPGHTFETYAMTGHGAEIWWGKPWVKDPAEWAQKAGFGTAGPRFDVPYAGEPNAFEKGVNTLVNGDFQCYITGQFHGLCMALAAGVPVLPIAGNSHKMQGMIRWSGLPVPLWDRNRHYRPQVKAARLVAKPFSEWVAHEVEHAETTLPQLLGDLLT